ncbi:MAG: hypothetical protein IPN32_27385 [Deltaproteobacteria bacterium]|nr:hypothetical protein [Deltaproteobacteria bacterium]
MSSWRAASAPVITSRRGPGSQLAQLRAPEASITSMRGIASPIARVADSDGSGSAAATADGDGSVDGSRGASAWRAGDGVATGSCSRSQAPMSMPPASA